MTNKWVLGRALKFILICVWVVPLPLGFAEAQSELIRKHAADGLSDMIDLQHSLN